MESAAELLSQGGVDSVSVVDIANSAGVSTRTFYNHFRDKYDLFLHLYTSDLERFYQEHRGHLTFRPFVLKSGQILWDHQEMFARYQKKPFFEDDFDHPLDRSDAGAWEKPLEMVRWAPSATNKQPWRVIVEGGRAHFFEKKTKGYERDSTGDI